MCAAKHPLRTECINTYLCTDADARAHFAVDRAEAAVCYLLCLTVIRRGRVQKLRQPFRSESRIQPSTQAQIQQSMSEARSIVGLLSSPSRRLQPPVSQTDGPLRLCVLLILSRCLPSSHRPAVPHPRSCFLSSACACMNAALVVCRTAARPATRRGRPERPPRRRRRRTDACHSWLQRRRRRLLEHSSMGSFVR